MKRTIPILLGVLTILMVPVHAFSQTAKDLLQKVAGAAKADTVMAPIIENPSFFNQNLVYKLRLDSIQRTVPLSYNSFVQDFIDRYSRRKELIGKMLGLSGYYFPIFEKALDAYQIPNEIKYLPIIESEMNPHAISRVGATGMWQFMFGTAKAYGLGMDNFVDERKDPIQASYAAAAYFRDAYEELGDWLLAIAAYNCGKGNVSRAMEKAQSRDFWAIRQFLPKETRDYVPAFIAAVYVMNYAKSHQIVAQAPSMTLKIDTVLVNHFVSLSEVAKAINFEESTLVGLNPSYKKKIVNGSPEAPKRIILPKVGQSDYAKLYDLFNNDFDAPTAVVLAATDDVRERRKKVTIDKPSPKIAIHKVAPGENLAKIADLYQVEVQDLKVWNGLKDNTLIVGQKLKVLGKNAPVKPVRPSFITYTVKMGDTLSGIAEKFDGLTVANLKRYNNLAKATLRPGMVLKIKS